MINIANLKSQIIKQIEAGKDRKEIEAWMIKKGVRKNHVKRMYLSLVTEVEERKRLKENQYSFGNAFMGCISAIFIIIFGAFCYLVVWLILINILSLLGDVGRFIGNLIERLPILAIVAIFLNGNSNSGNGQANALFLIGILLGVLITYLL